MEIFDNLIQGVDKETSFDFRIDLPRKLLLGLSFLVHCCNDDCFLLWSLLSD
jgi:hypothetical protein